MRRKLPKGNETSILIVEDNLQMSKTLYDILKEDGYSIARAETVAAAKLKIAEKFYNIVLADLKLLDGSGLDVLKAVKAPHPDTTVIIITAFASLETAVIALNEGAFAYLQKPLNPVELKLTIQKALRMQLLTAQNRYLLKQLQDLSLIDPHTGLYNYRYLKRRLEKELSRSKRHASPISIIMMDIDYFKSINDVYGHQYGDFILNSFGQFLVKFTRGSDVVVRYGGEEFVFLLMDTNKEGALLFGRRLLEKINEHIFDEKGHKINLKISMGLASYPEDQQTDTDDALIDLADRALSRAKEEGGNRIYAAKDIYQKEIKQELNKGGPDSVERLKNKLSKMSQRISNSLIESIYAFSKTIEARDSSTGDHSKKLIVLVKRMAKKLGLSSQETEDLGHAAVLHDLGKIGVSDAILHKKNKLSNTEFKKIQKHPQIGAEIIRPVHSLSGVIPSILYHHERYDGKGYCSGLKGEQIPVGARIVAVADVYQALVSDRPYRKAYSKQEALKIIKKGRGSQFDPKVVDAFEKIIKDPQL
ncbi:MAG: diguanylate cyclase [Candidatus Omnitrophica bacterium]|nr:diguanylate cyclase [Candidatus Omnitrophota bacterium]